jgi:hypothetical protein
MTCNTPTPRGLTGTIPTLTRMNGESFQTAELSQRGLFYHSNQHLAKPRTSQMFDAVCKIDVTPVARPYILQTIQEGLSVSRGIVTRTSFQVCSAMLLSSSSVSVTKSEDLSVGLGHRGDAVFDALIDLLSTHLMDRLGSYVLLEAFLSRRGDPILNSKKIAPHYFKDEVYILLQKDELRSLRKCLRFARSASNFILTTGVATDIPPLIRREQWTSDDIDALIQSATSLYCGAMDNEAAIRCDLVH